MPSAILSPSWGMMMSVATEDLLPAGPHRQSICRQFPRCRNNIARFRKKKFFQWRAERHRRVWRGDTNNWSVQRVKALLGKQRSDLGTYPAGLVILVQKNGLAGLTHRSVDRLFVERNQRA